MKILVYKRTHQGDPGPDGCFGIHDCMGSVRDRVFDAVIGVGGIGAEAQSQGISGMINWIGVGPHKREVGKRGSEVTFEHFVYYGKEGLDFRLNAPLLAERMYTYNVRSALDGLTDDEKTEAMAIVQLALDAPPSPALDGTTGSEAALSKCKRDGRSIKCPKVKKFAKEQKAKRCK
ncbi:hypothetical protein HNR65_002420 [Desulfosalsimonas propionicica]|uniref:Uncharacterized protein n=1 Tax=Desulfosalsimonas propionicica TaxID=332175 RepID=A0A7W0CAB7_9BACT|nr:hypothetical protein [Desulfosalsimonas propionicica]MBA2882086.1 hypothetical protein [Desulfosalsimonas propionicica]